MPLQIRRGTDAERLTMTVPLAAGELVYVTDTQRLYIGNGSTLGGVGVTGFTTEDAQDATAELFANGTHTNITFTYNDATGAMDVNVSAAGYTDEEAQDAAAALFTDGTHSSISFTYNDSSNTIDAVVDLSSYSGDITATAVQSSLFADDSSILVNSTTKAITVNTVTATTFTGYHVGDVTGSVFSDNSLLMVDATSNRLISEVVATPILTSPSGDDLNITAVSPGSIVFSNATSSRVKFIQNSYESTFDDGILFAQSHDTADAVNINYYRSRGTYGSPSAVQIGDELSEMAWYGQDSTARRFAGSLTVSVEDTPTSSGIPAKLVWRASNGTTTNDLLSVSSSGTLSINSIAAISGQSVDFSNPVGLPVYADGTARDAAITSPTAGMLAYLEDAGSGNPGVTVYYAGSINNWATL